MRYTQAFYPSWDESYAGPAFATISIGIRRKRSRRSPRALKRAKVGLLTALAYRPELLICRTSPSSGLDPVVATASILEAIIRMVADAGRTVLFSSHLLDEVERVADYVVMLQRGGSF